MGTHMVYNFPGTSTAPNSSLLEIVYECIQNLPLRNIISSYR
jgi:hypothetical protein